MLIKYSKIKYSNFNHKKGNNEFPFFYIKIKLNELCINTVEIAQNC